MAAAAAMVPGGSRRTGGGFDRTVCAGCASRSPSGDGAD